MTEAVRFGGREYEVIDLSQHFSNATSTYEPMPHRIEFVTHAEAAPAVEARHGIPTSAWPGREAWAYERMTMTTHSGTHIDAPYHYAPRTSAGAPARTIDDVPLQWLMSDGFVLEMMDIERSAGITATDVRHELDRIGYTPKANDIALVRTDVSRHYHEAGYDLLHPGLRRDATAWLVDQGVRLIGIDAWGIDRPMDLMAAEARAGNLSQLWESHKYGAEREYSQIEKLANLAEIPQPFGFTVLALPVVITGASAGWARVVALLEASEQPENSAGIV